MIEAITIPLPARLDHEGTRFLQAALREQRGRAIRLDAGKTILLGALALQLLLAAAREWRAAGHSFVVTPRSPAFTDDLMRLGASIHDLNEETP